MRKYLTRILLRDRFSGIITILLISTFSLRAFPQGVPSREYHLKAAFLFHFSQFIEWPPQAFAAPGSPFIIGILGEDPFRALIDQTVAGEKVKDHPIVVHRFATVNDILPCHILYISEKPEGFIPGLFALLPAKYTLTVGDQYAFARVGGIIRFQTLNKKIRLQINLSAAKAADLNISSKLLRLADIVHPMDISQ